MTLFNPPLREGQARDPVCGMAVDTSSAKHVAEQEGATFYFCCDGCRQKFLADPKKFAAAPAEAGARATDPVCGMKVDPETAKHKTNYQGRPYYFCSARCREKFEAEPARFLAGPERPALKAAPDAVYTCPMHPEIRQVGPGACPICGWRWSRWLQPPTPVQIQSSST